jgi:hypothetical protein
MLRSMSSKGSSSGSKKTFTIPTMGIFRNFFLLYILATILVLFTERPPALFVYPLLAASITMIIIYGLVKKFNAWDDVKGMGEGAIWFASIVVMIFFFFHLVPNYPDIFINLAPLNLASLSLTVVDGLPISYSVSTAAIFYTCIILALLWAIIMTDPEKKENVMKRISKKTMEIRL